MLITAWGTANMRTGGDDIAQALALMGVKPKWDSANRRDCITFGAIATATTAKASVKTWWELERPGRRLQPK